MSESLKDLTQKHKANALQKLDEEIQHLRLLQRLLQSQAQNFFETRLRFHNEAGLIISQVKLQKSHILATKHSNKAFQERITSDLKDHLDEDFLEGFNEVVEKKIALVRDRQKNKEIRGILLVLAKSQSRPIFFRLDYCFIHQKVEHPILRSNVPQIILIAYTLSTIKREVFTKEDVSYFIKNGFDILDIVPNKEKKLNVSSLIGRVASVTEAYQKKKSFLYKDLEKVRLTYINQRGLQKFNQGLRNFKQIRLALIYTKWQDGFEYFGTAFFYSETVLLTSFYNVTKRNGHQIKGVFICLKPKENIEWEEVKLQTQVTKVQQFAMIRILSAQNLKNRPLIQIDGSTQLSQHVDCLYIYGYQFQKGQDGLMFKQNISFVQIGNHPSFDSYSKVKSKASIGSLCFTISDSRAIAFGVYNPLSKSVFDFDLFHAKLPKLIEALTDKSSTQSQVIVDPLPDKRTQVDQSKLQFTPYSAIGMIIATNNIYDDKGRIKATNYSQGTGTFITQNIILTCGHNVISTFYDQDLKITNGDKVAKLVSFYAGYSSTKAYTSIEQIVNNQKPTYSISSQNIYIHESYGKSYALNNDIAILHLTKQNHTSHLDIKSTEITDQQFWGNTTLTICGYPLQTYGKLRQHSGKAQLNTSKQDLLFYKIDTTTGNSGSAVIFKNQDKFEIVAVHTAGSTANKINFGPLLVGENLEFIEERVRSLSENITSPVPSLRQIEMYLFNP